jgi:hypothetical protein
MAETNTNKYAPTRENLLLGDELFVYTQIGELWEPVAFSSSCSLSLSSDSIDTSNKMSGVWTSALPGKLSWTISTESLMSYNETGYGYFFEKLTSREAFKLRFGQATSVEEADFAMNETKVYYEGEAFCTSCNLTADNGGVCTMSIEFTGNGELKKVATA